MSADVIQRTNIRMVQAGNGPGFTFKALAQIGSLRQKARQNFDRHSAIQPSVFGFVNLSHSSGAQHNLNLVRPEFSPNQ